MKKISFLGCGSWGGALGLALANKGIGVTMWHRNPDVAQSLIDQGAIELLKSGLAHIRKINTFNQT